jgi:PhnB protein
VLNITAHLHFDGECEAAFRVYQRLLNGELKTLLTYGESPLADQFPAEMGSKILHATLRIGAQELSGADVRHADYRKPQGFSVMLALADLAKADALFRGLAEGGQVHLPFEKTFWAAGYGMLVDRFSVPWQINCEKTG